MDDLWVEKYRPKTLGDVAGHQAVLQRLQAYVKAGAFPHLLFAGPPGTGKTTSALALVRDFYGVDRWRDNFQELNASDERGIGVVRDKVKNFARTAPIGGVPFKTLFLDEADALTPEAQAALRRTMERYSHTCRFILSCNYSSKIIDPIQSRCAVFRFSPVQPEAILSNLKHIAKAEKLKVTEDGYEALLYVAHGDMRRAVTALQVAATVAKTIDGNVLYQTTATGRPEDIKALIEEALKGDFAAARVRLDDLLVTYGLSGEDVIKQIHRTLFDVGLPDRQRVEIVDRCGEIEFRIVEGANERIQLEALLAHLVLVGAQLR